MATLVADGALDLAALRAHLARALPSYARPLFLRIKDRIEVTATFKHKKSELQARRLRSRGDQRCDLFRRPGAASLRAARCRALRAHPRRPRSGCRSCRLAASFRGGGFDGFAQGEVIAFRRHFEMAMVKRGERRAMTDGHDRGLRQPPRQYGVKLGLKRLLDRGGGLVEQEPIGPHQQRARDRQALLLAARQPLRPDLFVIEFAGEIAEMCVDERGADVVIV